MISIFVYLYIIVLVFFLGGRICDPCQVCSQLTPSSVIKLTPRGAWEVVFSVSTTRLHIKQALYPLYLIKHKDK